MEIKLFRSATVGIHTKGFKILQDPWLTDGEYYGSWSHYPFYDLDSNLNEINKYDAIYISHIHPDHCSEETLKKINKSIPVYIHKFHSKFLKFKIERLGFKVIEIENGKKIDIGKGIHLTIYAADNCDPKLCYKFTACADMSAKEGSQQIDTISIIDDGKNTVMNVNDCPYELAKNTFSNIKRNFDHIDVLLHGYGGAGPFPQCFDNLNLDQKIKAAANKKDQFLMQALNYLKDIKPSFHLPFAGTYTLSGKLSKLQDLRGIPTMKTTHEYFKKNLSKNLLKNTQTIKLNPDDIFDLNLNEYTKPFKDLDFDDYKTYIKNYLSVKKLDYEKLDEPNIDEIFELAKGAYKRFNDKKLINNVKLNSDIYIKFKKMCLYLPKNNHDIDIIDYESINRNSRYIIYNTDIRFLKQLLKGPRFAHWNNAEIGSHINFYRSTDEYERNLHSSICYFHN
tara:strand:- start:821 stop:2173 length:1353 start_codon:yes stop_codon:yes gene_type:complete